MIALKLRKVGNSVGTVLPQEVLNRLHLGEGDTVFLTKAPDDYRVTPIDPRFEDQMTAARRIMKKRRNVLRELAK
jgi:putative addiction module antidote